MNDKLTVGELVYRISGDMKDLKTSLSKAEAEINNLKGSMEKADTTTTSLNKSFSFLKLTVLGFATGALIKLKQGFTDAINNASNLGESVNAVNVVFGNGADKILKFGEDAAKSVGLAASEFNQLSTVTGALLKDTGLSMEDVAGKTIDLTKRAADMASVFNTDVTDALSAINQAIRGETQAIRKYAGNVTDAEIENELLSRGIKKSSAELSEQEKRLIRLDIIMRQTAISSGDFAKTSDEVANKTRILKAEIQNKSAELGQRLLPLYKLWIDLSLSVVENIDKVIEAVKTLFLTIAAYVATSKFTAFLTLGISQLKLFAGGLGLTTLALKIKMNAMLLWQAAMVRARTAVIALNVSLGILAAVATAAALLIINASKKVVRAWEEADQAQLDSSNANLYLTKLNLERRRLAEKSSSKAVQDLAQAEYEFQKGIIEGLTNDQMKELDKRRQNAREALQKDSEDVEEWKRINIDAREKINNKIDETGDKSADAAEAARNAREEAEKEARELESLQQNLLDLLEASKDISKTLQEDFTKSLGDAGKGLAEIVVGAQDQIKELKDELKGTDDADREKEIRDEIKKQEEILKARKGFEERQAEQVKAIREKLSKVGFTADELDKLIATQTLEEQITEQRRLNALDEFTRFEELQNEKLEKIVDDMIARREMENDLTAFLISQDAMRQESVVKFANEAIKKYDDMAKSLRTAISLQAQLNALKSGGKQFHSGGYVGADGSEVHAGEYVIPANMVSKFGSLVSSLENERAGNISNKTVNAPINITASNVSGVDFNAFSKELAWELNRK